MAENFENFNNKEKLRRKERYSATPIGATTEIHIFEVEYEEIAPGVWQQVPGTAKDLGPLNKSSAARFKREDINPEDVH
jgi:hypothetical protein